MQLRIVTLNLWNEQGPHEARLDLAARQMAALQPDVVCLQEVRERLPAIANQASTLATRLGMTAVFAPVAEWDGGVEGLAILSRLPIRQHKHVALPDPEAIGPRRVLGAVLEAPAGTVAVATTHLAYQLGAGLTREAQVLAVDNFMLDLAADGVRIVTGDFNAAPDTDEIRFMRGLTSLAGRRTVWQDAFLRVHPDEKGLTWSSANPYTAAVAHVDLDRRLDYVFVSPRTRDGRARIVDARVVLAEPEQGIFPSDHFGVLADVVF